MTGSTDFVVLASRESGVVEAVTALGLALQISVTVVEGSEELRRAWPEASLRLVGSDMSARAAQIAPSPGTWVIGNSPEALVRASAELNAPALAIPDQVGRLAEIMTTAVLEEPAGRVLAVVGASGGLGVSSLAVALAARAADEGGAALVELAEAGGGLDLLIGAEMLEGYRWNQLARTRGELGQLSGLVHVDGVDLLALDRSDTTHPDEPATTAVLRSLSRSHPTVVVDAGLGVGTDLVPGAELVMLVAADVRGVAAGRMAAERRPALSQAHLVVRRGPGRDLPPGVVADTLGMPLAGVIRHDAMVPRLTADGSSVAARVARRYQRDVAALWRAVSP